MPTIVAYTKPPERVLAFLEQHAEVKIRPAHQDEEAFLQALPEADGLIGAGYPVNEKLLEMAPHLKVVSNVSTGYDNLDMKALTARGITATNTPYVLIDTVADTIMGMMLAAARRIPQADRSVKEGRWKDKRDESFFGVNVHHKTLGIIGMGKIGEEVARRASAGFHMDVLYHNRSEKQNVEAVYAGLDELLEASDFVLLMTPLTAETKHFIRREHFRKMKKTAVFLNAARGAVVKETDLIEALETKEILAAGIDVYEQEPVDPDNPLLALDSAVTLPHIGSATAETREAMYQDAAEQCAAALAGKVPEHKIEG
ncbi:D-glycerate dehydrogenase [Sinobaca sp. H24]|uniref:2-hydroxyacid dehydrogenase n=1 Tax=Sinobaca sp. H24 TaxID=2923376 RepID=UPI00207996F4|nr:D-glycerate dehydrogenase [Sinobaca sp. H24]